LPTQSPKALITGVALIVTVFGLMSLPGTSSASAAWRAKGAAAMRRRGTISGSASTAMPRCRFGVSKRLAGNAEMLPSSVFMTPLSTVMLSVSCHSSVPPDGAS
jgi:hypothetical protein